MQLRYLNLHVLTVIHWWDGILEYDQSALIIYEVMTGNRIFGQKISLHTKQSKKGHIRKSNILEIFNKHSIIEYEGSHILSQIVYNRICILQETEYAFRLK